MAEARQDHPVVNRRRMLNSADLRGQILQLDAADA